MKNKKTKKVKNKLNQKNQEIGKKKIATAISETLARLATSRFLCASVSPLSLNQNENPIKINLCQGKISKI